MMVHRCTETAGLTGIATMLQLLVKYGANSSRRRTRAHGCVRIKQMHVHAHGAEHDPHAHSHSHSHVHMHGAIHSKGMANVLGAAVVVTLALVAVEFTAGYFGHSIALISDAVHNLTDVPTIFISWIAMRLAERPPTREHTYGYHRAGILAAFTNAFFLSIVAAGDSVRSHRPIAPACRSQCGRDALGFVDCPAREWRHHPCADLGPPRSERAQHSGAFLRRCTVKRRDHRRRAGNPMVWRRLDRPADRRGDWCAGFVVRLGHFARDDPYTSRRSSSRHAARRCGALNSLGAPRP